MSSKIKFKQTKDITLNNVVLNGGITDQRIDFINNNSGIILTSPDETRWRVTINTDGQLITTTIGNPINYCPQVWLDARTVTYNTNNEITLWDDSSGNNNGATQGGTGSTTFGSTAFNGTQSVVFDGVNHEHMLFSIGVTASEATYFIVYEPTSTPIVGSTVIADADIQGTSNLHDKRIYHSGTSTAYLRNDGPTNTRSVGLSTYNILAIRWGTGSTSSYRLNNGSWTDFTQDGGTDTSKFILGNWTDPTVSGGRPMGMNLAQVVVYDYLIPDWAGDEIFTYFNDLYSVY